MNDSSVVFLLLLLGVVFYFTPTFIAGVNKSNRMAGIFWLNFLLGWSGIGWIAALIWAMVSHRENRRTLVGTVSTPHSAADEILKLKKLAADGVITDEEFESQKNALLLK